jgi:hypothetical protein
VEHQNRTMEEQTQAAPEGVSEPTPAPAAAPQDTSIHGIARLMEPREKPEAAAAAEEAPAESAPEESAEQPPEEGNEQPAPEAEPEATPEPEETFVHGNAKTRMRDGTPVAVADLKKGWDELKEYKAKVPQLSAYEQQLREAAAQVAQQQQHLHRILPGVIETQRSRIPPPPDPSLLQTDPIAHYEQKVAHDNAVSYLQGLEAADAATRQQEAKRQQDQFQSYVAEQKQKLYEKLPDLSNPQRRDEVYKGCVDTANEFGFSKDEVDAVYDHRLLHMVHTLAAERAEFRKLKAERAKQTAIVKAKTPAVPAATPQRRVSTQESAVANRQELISRVQSSGGNMRDVAAAMQKLGL